LWAVVELFRIRRFDVAIVICTQQVAVNTGNTSCIQKTVRVGKFVAIYAKKPRKECGCWAVLVRKSEQIGLSFIMVSLMTMHLIVKIF